MTKSRKIEIKRQILRLREDLKRHKLRYKIANENFKRKIKDLRLKASKSDRNTAANIRRQISSMKSSFMNEKRNERLITQRLKQDISRLILKLRQIK